MSIERLKSTKEMLMAQIEGQLGHLNDVDAKELGEVVDMVKDLEEAIYYCTITEAMKKKEEEPIAYYSERRKYVEPIEMYYSEPRQYLDYNRRYTEGNGGSQRNGYSEAVPYTSGNWDNNSQYSENNSRSDVSRKTYMEHKRMHSDKTVKMRDLENYISELTHDMTEMIEGASPEEKQLLQQKISTLAQKIV